MCTTYKAYDIVLKVLEEKTCYDVVTKVDELKEFINRTIKPYNFPDERVYVIAFDVKGMPIGYVEHSRGSVNCSMIDIPQIFKFALLCNASSIAVTHNHPSGDITPSLEDQEVTKAIFAACEIMKITMLDHIITSPTGDFFSFREKSLHPF